MISSKNEAQINNFEVKKEFPRNINNFIYLRDGDNLFEFELKLDTMTLANMIEKYMGIVDLYDMKVASKKEILKNSNLSLKFLLPIGKFRMQGNLFRTDNYLIPRSKQLDLLGQIYKNNGVINYDSFNLIFHVLTIDDELSKLIKEELSSNLQTKLNSIYDISLKNIDEIMDNYVLFIDDDTTKEVLGKLNFLLKTSIENKDRIEILGLKDKIDTFMHNKQKQKTK